jgi:CcmD family protein
VTNAEKYVAAAYLVVFAIVLAYVLIISLKLVRLEREVEELTELARRRQAPTERPREATPVG